MFGDIIMSLYIMAMVFVDYVDNSLHQKDILAAIEMAAKTFTSH